MAPRVTPLHRRKAQPKSVIRYNADGSYVWECLACGKRALSDAHRGPRKRLCDRCIQHKHYRDKNPVVKRAGTRDAIKDKGRFLPFEPE